MSDRAFINLAVIVLSISIIIAGLSNIRQSRQIDRLEAAVFMTDAELQELSK